MCSPAFGGQGELVPLVRRAQYETVKREHRARQAGRPETIELEYSYEIKCSVHRPRPTKVNVRRKALVLCFREAAAASTALAIERAYFERS